MDIPTGYGQFNILFEGDGAPLGAQVTHGFQADPLEPDPLVLGATILTTLAASDWKEMWHASVNVVGCLVKLGPNDTGPSAIASTVITGQYAAGDAVTGTSFLIHKNTPLGGRAGRGRMYWPGLPLAEVDEGGLINGATLDDWTAAVQDWYARLDDAGINLFLLHGEDSPISSPTPLLSWVIDAKAATQRRRLRR